MKPRPLILTPAGWEPCIYVCEHIRRGDAKRAFTLYTRGEIVENFDFMCGQCKMVGQFLPVELPMSVAHELVKGICPVRPE